MSNPFFTKAHPKHYLYTAVADLLLAIPVACVWQGVIKLEHEVWQFVPAWAWPTVTLLLVVSSGYSLWRHYHPHRR